MEFAGNDHIVGGSDQPPSRIRRLGVDFQKDNLGSSLTNAGWSAKLRTLFIWEGVTNYLDSRSVEAVFNFFAADACSGFRIIFIYVHADVLNSSVVTLGVFA